MDGASIIGAGTVEMIPGQLVADKGVFVGVWRPRDAAGKSMARAFNLFAAPTDIQGVFGLASVMTFDGATLLVSQLKDWHGHDGSCLSGEASIQKAAQERGAPRLKQWFIPTLGMLSGKKTIALSGSLYEGRHENMLKGTFATEANGPGLRHHYWSSTEVQGAETHVWVTNFNSGEELFLGKDLLKCSVRPVRAELCAGR